jgi:uncharacterized membrane protein
MERLILEITNRGLNQYHTLDQFPVKIGRAYDNDIILSHRSISAHHLMIDKKDDNTLVIKNLSEENGTQVNKETVEVSAPVDVPYIDDSFLANIQMGQLKTRLVTPFTPIAETHSKHCDGWFCRLIKPAWSTALLLLTFAAVILNSYLETQTEQNVYYYLQNTVSVFVGLVVITIVFTGITKLVTHCWQFFPVLSISSLLVLIPEVFNHAGHFINYLLTSDMPLSILGFISNFLLLPILLYLFINRLNRYPKWPAAGIAVLVSSPFILYQVYDVVDRGSFGLDFSDEAPYNRTLSHLDVHMKPTLELDDFLQASKDELQNKIDKEKRQYFSEENEE